MIRNFLGTCIGKSREVVEGGSTTYARICVKIDLKKPLPIEIKIRLCGNK